MPSGSGRLAASDRCSGGTARSGPSVPGSVCLLIYSLLHSVRIAVVAKLLAGTTQYLLLHTYIHTYIHTSRLL